MIASRSKNPKVRIFRNSIVNEFDFSHSFLNFKTFKNWQCFWLSLGYSDICFFLRSSFFFYYMDDNNSSTENLEMLQCIIIVKPRWLESLEEQKKLHLFWLSTWTLQIIVHNYSLIFRGRKIKFRTLPQRGFFRDFRKLINNSWISREIWKIFSTRYWEQ